MIWVLCEKAPDGKLTGVGLAGSEDQARQMVSDGTYVAVPTDLGRIYPDIVDDGLPGAVLFAREGVSTKLQRIEASISKVESDLTSFRDQTNQALTDLRDDVNNLQNSANDLQASITDLDGRISALEAAEP